MHRMIRLTAALTAALVLSSCKEAPPHSPPPARPILDGPALRFPAGHPQLAALATIAAEAPAPRSVEMPARVVWDEDRTQRIYPAFAGKVSAIRADVGTRITAGQALVELASPEFGIAQTEAARARAELTQVGRQLERVRDLHALGIAARKELEQIEAEAQRAQAELARAQARIRLYGGTEQVDQKLAIVAGVSGVVVERNINPGQELRPEQYGPGSAALFILTNPDQLWLQIDVRESHLALLTPGRIIEFVAHAYPERSFAAKILAVGDAIDPLTRTLKVRAAVGNVDRLLKVEMLGKVRLSAPPGEGVVVPAASVLGQAGAHRVYVSTNTGVFEPRPVQISYLGSDKVLVTRGLGPGEQVVADNALLLARIYRTAMEAREHSSSGPKGPAR